jgi:glycosyltransferase involved in cell wall biosynthesis
MPAYDAAAFVGEAIESVLAQTFTDWELVIVDDGSTDNTREVVAVHDDPRVRLLTIEHSGLPAVARNRGLAASESRYVGFLDADDLWRPHKLARQLAVFDSRPEVGLVHTGFERLRDGLLEPYVPPPQLRASGPEFERLAVGHYIANSSVLLRRELLTRHGFFDEDPRLGGTEDFELWMRLAPHSTFAYVDEPLAVYRLHAANLGQGEQMGVGYVTTMEKMERLHPELVAGLGVPYWRMLGYYRASFGLEGRGRREFLRVLRRCPRDRSAWRWLARSFLPADLAREHRGLLAWTAQHVYRRVRERRARSSRA